MIYDTAIVGGGVAGYTAALTAKSLKLRYLWFADDGFGEKTKKAEYVRNFPAFTGGGKEFCAALEMQREKRASNACKSAWTVFTKRGRILCLPSLRKRSRRER